MNRQHILILDDEAIIRDMLEAFLSKEYKITQTENGYEALEILSNNEIDLALVDIRMPVMNGIDFIKRASISNPDIAFIIISGEHDIDAAIEALHFGVLDFIKKPFDDFLWLKKVIKQSLEKRGLLLENRKYRESLEQLVKKRTEELELKNKELIYSQNRIVGILSTAAEYKDYETGQHFLRVSQYSGIIAEALELDDKKVEIIRQAAPVHDIGKIGIPESLLLKQGRLTNKEYVEMQNHCVYGEEILRSHSLNIFLSNNHCVDDINITYPDELLDTAANIAKSHHERYDGSGYPDGLKENDIPLEAKIVAVADVYDAIGTERPYKKAWDEYSCREYIENNSGILFDPDVVNAFFFNIDKIGIIKNTFIDNAADKKSYVSRKIMEHSLSGD